MIILNRNNLDSAVQYLKDGLTLVFPSETCYGLGCDATNQEAVDKIFKIKGRGRYKSLLAVVPSVQQAKKILKWNGLLEELSAKYWPGPLTIVGEYNGGDLAEGVVSAENTVALRVSDHETLKFLSEKLGHPLVATSANPSDIGELYDFEEVKRYFSEQVFKPDAALDFGKLPTRPPTTLVSVTDGEIQVLREGEIKI